MNGYANAAAMKTYLAGKVADASPAEITLMLYDEAIRRVQQATDEFTRINALAGGIALYRALAIIGELQRSLDHGVGGEIAANLYRLYRFMHDELVKANLERRADRLGPVRQLLGELREAWLEAMNQARMQAAAETPGLARAAAGTAAQAPLAAAWVPPAPVDGPRVLVKA